MASIRTVERQIGHLEHFDVCFLHLDGKDVRSDMHGLPTYNAFHKAAKGTMTVSEWREQRFKKCYPGFNCDVLNAKGQVCHGGYLLSTVRDTYTG